MRFTFYIATILITIEHFFDKIKDTRRMVTSWVAYCILYIEGLENGYKRAFNLHYIIENAIDCRDFTDDFRFLEKFYETCKAYFLRLQ